MTRFTLDPSIERSIMIDIAAGNVKGMSIIHKFGRNSNVGTSFVPITGGGNYRTPTALTSLEVVSGDAQDGVGGIGARTITIEGLSTDWRLVTETVTMNGTTAVALANQYFRIFRLYVEESGTYATQAAPSHQGDITLRETGGGDTWVLMNDSATFARGQSQIGAYTVPMGYTAFIMSTHVHVDTNKVANLLLFRREGTDDITSPFSAMRLINELDGVTGTEVLRPIIPIGPFPEKTDLGLLGKVSSGVGSISVDMEILLVENTSSN